MSLPLSQESKDDARSMHPYAGVDRWRTELVEKADRALAYFRKRTREAGLEEILDDAVERGKERPPKRIDIVVHPEFAWHPSSAPGSSTIVHARSRYRQQIDTVLSAESDTIVLGYPNARQAFHAFPYADDGVIPTVDPKKIGGISGMLDADGISQLMERMGSIRKDDDIRLHGAAFNRCPKTFGRQLFAAALFQTYIPPLPLDGSSPEQTQHIESLFSLLYQANAIREQTRFRIGIQYNSFAVTTPDSMCADMLEPGITEIYPKPQFRYPNAILRPNLRP